MVIRLHPEPCILRFFPKNMAQTYPITPVKSDSDERSYRVIKLENDIEAILISDPDADKAGAALDVHVGHFSDPAEVPGLAHFLEHMLFMGTKTFPDENLYSKMISEHGGRSNAYTSTENTNYYFDVLPEKLEKILELFAGFFTEPLFAPSSTEREMKAVHSENAQNLLNDAWRQYQLLKSTSNPAHPFSKFGTGNLETLRDKPKERGVETRQELLKFHDKLYSANIMKLCILGKNSLDDLEALAKKYFSKIVNKKLQVPTWTAEPFASEGALGHIYEVVPVKELRTLSLLWPMPSVRAHYKSKPSSLLSHLLGHEGEGSILAVLKKKGWANELSAGTQADDESFSTFGVTMDLTPQGLENWQKITTLIYQYIKLIANASDEQWERTFQECRDVSAMNFRFKAKESPFNYCSRTASKMHKYAATDILQGPWIYREKDVKLVRSFVDKMVPENMRVQIVSPTFKGSTELQEKWYKTDYNRRKFEADMVKEWKNPGEDDSKELHLPKPNEFIATNFNLVMEKKDKKKEGKNGESATATFPTKIVDEEGLTAWHKTDDTFFKPKGHVFISIECPQINNTPESVVLGQMFVRATEESLSEFSYDAEISGLSYALTLTKKGLQLTVAGYTHKLHVLLYKVLERVKKLSIEKSVFERLKERIVREYCDTKRQQPYRHAIYFQSRALGAKKFALDSTIEAHGILLTLHKYDKARKIELGDLEAFASTLTINTDVECMVFGNFTVDQAKDIVAKMKSILKHKPLPPSLRAQLRCVDLAAGETYLCQRKGMNEADVNSCVCALYQIGGETYPMLARLSMICHLIREPAFDQLRTKEQLGYTVFSLPISINGCWNVLVIVQSPSKGAKYLDDRVEAFIAKYRKDLEAMEEKTFQSNLASLIKKKLEKDKSMGQEGTRHWGRILFKDYDFDRREKEVAELKKLEKKDILDFFDRYIAISSTRSKLSTQVFGKDRPIGGGKEDEEKAKEKAEGQQKGDKEEEEVELPPVPEDPAKKVSIDDVEEFVRSMNLYPCFLR